MAEQRSQDPEYRRRYAKLHRNGYRLSVPALGCQRRLQALQAIGYSWRQLEEITGLSRPCLRSLAHGKYTRIRARTTAKPIIEAYRTLCVQPLHNTPSASKVRGYARMKGWAPPMAWDDIDDPNDQPKGVEGGGQLTEDEVRQIRRLYAEGVPQVEISRRYGFSRSTVSRVVRGLIWKQVA